LGTSGLTGNLLRDIQGMFIGLPTTSFIIFFYKVTARYYNIHIPKKQS